MSRGPGAIERAIARQIKADRERQSEVLSRRMPVMVTSWSLVMELYRPAQDGWHWQPSRTQRTSVVRAMHSFVRKHQQYALMGGNGRKELMIYDTDDPVSVAGARLFVTSRNRPSMMDVRSFMEREAERDAFSQAP